MKKKGSVGFGSDLHRPETAPSPKGQTSAVRKLNLCNSKSSSQSRLKPIASTRSCSSPIPAHNPRAQISNPNPCLDHASTQEGDTCHTYSQTPRLQRLESTRLNSTHATLTVEARLFGLVKEILSNFHRSEPPQPDFDSN